MALIKAEDKSGSGALGRGLRVLVALNDLQSATVSGLVAETQLPKPTAIRLLQNLVDLGYAHHDLETGTYRVTAKVASLSRGLMGRGPADEALRDVLDGLADSLKWPAEFLIRDGSSMVVQANNRERAPIKLTLFERRRFPLLLSAAGVAVLSQVAPSEAKRAIARIAKTPEDATQAEARIVQARKTGYAHRPLVELAENMVVASVAIPGFEGALSLVYFEDVLPRAAFEDRALGLLQGAAREIGAAYSAQ